MLERILDPDKRSEVIPGGKGKKGSISSFWKILSAFLLLLLCFCFCWKIPGILLDIS